MKKLISIITLICISVVVSAQSKIDVLHYRFEISLTDSSDTISGIATITVKFLEEADRLSFDLTSLSEGKGMSVFSITENSDDNKMIPNSHLNNKITINLLQKKKRGETGIFVIQYKGIPANGLIISKNQFGNRTFFADNWPNRAHNWIPCVDDPADKAAVEFIVTAPSHYQIISNGVQIEETNLLDNKKLTHYKEDVPLPTKVMVIGAADFAVSRVGDINCVPVYSWIYPENKIEGFTDYAMAKDILAYHINYIGPYPYKKLANVQSKTKFGGMENAGAIFYAENLVNGLEKEEELISHEIVHQWFGDMATEKSFAHLWLSEGFATYLTHVYIESKYGTDSLNIEMANDRDVVIDFVKINRRPVVDSVSSFLRLLNANSYKKGSWVLHMLRRQLGDSIFRKSIRLYYATYAGKNAETKDLQKIFESVSGKNLEKFFSQWLFSPVNPSLKIIWKYLAKEKKIKLDILQTQNETVFNMPLEIEMLFPGGKRVIMPVSITTKSQSFMLSATGRPTHINLDPKTSLLFEGTIVELK